MDTPSLRRRTVVSSLVILAVVIAITSTGVYLVVSTHLEANLVEVLGDRVEVTRDFVRDDLDADALEDALSRRGIRATISTADGRQLTTQPAFFRIGTNLPSGRRAGHVLSQEVALPDGGVVTVAVSRDGIDTTLRRLLLAEVATAVAALVITGALVSRATRRALAPIDRVVSVARDIAAGHTGQRLRPTEPDTDLGRLATAFDEMLDAQDDALAAATASDERSRQFLSDAAHQLRTPIATVSNTVQALTYHPTEAERRWLTRQATIEAARAGRLITDLLRLSTLDGHAPLHRSPVDLTAIVRAEVGRRAEAEPVIEVDAPDRPVEACVDAAALGEALANLLDNALRHARTAVTVSVDRAGDRAEVSVIDDGDGIPPGAEDRVFERLASLDGHGGTGLGLPIARDVARAHGGDLTLRDGAFVLSVPLRPVGG